MKLKITMAKRLAQKLINKKGTCFRVKGKKGFDYYTIEEANHMILNEFLNEYPLAQIETRSGFYSIA